VEDDENESSVKRARGEDGTLTPACDESPAQHDPEVKEVKEVTQGVKKVDLEDGIPESVPLPASPLPEAQHQEVDDADDNENTADSPTKSIKSTSANGSPSSDKSAEQPNAANVLVPVKSRTTCKLPNKSARPSSKGDKVVESNEETSGEVADSKQDGESA